MLASSNHYSARFLSGFVGLNMLFKRKGLLWHKISHKLSLGLLMLALWVIHPYDSYLPLSSGLLLFFLLFGCCTDREATEDEKPGDEYVPLVMVGIRFDEPLKVDEMDTNCTLPLTNAERWEMVKGERWWR